jgi:LemA protein
MVIWPFTYIVYAVLALLALGGIGYVVSIFNSLVQVRNNIFKSWENIDVLLIQRNEEIPKLIDTAKSYGVYENRLLGTIVKLRTQYASHKGTSDKTLTENTLGECLRNMTARGENYPDLKANTVYQKIQKRISDLEASIADRRTFFNKTVKIYNTQIEQFPQMLFARFLNFQAHPYLTGYRDTGRENPVA